MRSRVLTNFNSFNIQNLIDIFDSHVTFKASKTVPDGHLPGQIGMIRRVVLNKDNEHGLGLAVIGKLFFTFVFDEIYLIFRWQTVRRAYISF